MPGDGVTGGDHDRPGGVAVEPDDASGCQRGSHRHAADVHVMARRSETPRGGKDEDYEDRDGHNRNEPQHMNPRSLHNLTTSGGIALLYLSLNEKTSYNSRPVARPTMRFAPWSRPRSQQGPNRVRAIRWSMKAARLFLYV